MEGGVCVTSNHSFYPGKTSNFFGFSLLIYIHSGIIISDKFSEEIIHVNNLQEKVKKKIIQLIGKKMKMVAEKKKSLQQGEAESEKKSYSLAFLYVFFAVSAQKSITLFPNPSNNKRVYINNFLKQKKSIIFSFFTIDSEKIGFVFKPFFSIFKIFSGALRAPPGLFFLTINL